MFKCSRGSRVLTAQRKKDEKKKNQRNVGASGFRSKSRVFLFFSFSLFLLFSFSPFSIFVLSSVFSLLFFLLCGTFFYKFHTRVSHNVVSDNFPRLVEVLHVEHLERNLESTSGLILTWSATMFLSALVWWHVANERIF